MPPIKIENSIFTVEIENTEDYFLIYLMDPEDFISGSIQATRSDELNCYTVETADAPEGYGPALYDLAIEFATTLNHQLMPSLEVNKESAKVWSYYLNNRPDVRKKDMKSTLDHSRLQKLNKKWSDLNISGKNPLVFGYIKLPKTISILEDAGKLRFNG